MRRTVGRWFLAYVPAGASTEVHASPNPHTVTAAFRRTEQAARHADEEKANRGFFYLPRLDYDTGTGVAPLLSRAQFELQYHVLHKDAVHRLNTHTLGTALEGHNLEAVVRSTAFDATQAVTHSAAAEHFNYCFWYRSLRPWGTSVPSRLREALQLQYSRNGALDAVEEVKRQIVVAVLSQQTRCGWVYLVWTGKGFDIVDFQHGTCPIGSDLIPLLALNVHESAMHIDYAGGGTAEALEQYVHNYFKTCNWGVAESYYLQAVQKTL